MTERHRAATAWASGAIGWLTAEREPGSLAEFIASAIRYVISGGAAVVVDVGALFLLRSALHAPLSVSTVLSYGLSLIVTYWLNRLWVFSTDSDLQRSLGRFVVLVAINVGLTLGFVLGLSAAGVYYIVAKLISVVVNGVLNFFAFRYWVLR